MNNSTKKKSLGCLGRILAVLVLHLLIAGMGMGGGLMFLVGFYLIVLALLIGIGKLALAVWLPTVVTVVAANSVKDKNILAGLVCWLIGYVLLCAIIIYLSLKRDFDGESWHGLNLQQCLTAAVMTLPIGLAALGVRKILHTRSTKIAKNSSSRY